MKKLFLLIAMLGSAAQSQAAFVKHFMQKLPVKTVAAGALTGFAVRSYQHADQSTKDTIKKYAEKGTITGATTIGATASFTYGFLSPFLLIGTGNPKIAAPRLAIATAALSCIVIPAGLTYCCSQLLHDVDKDYAHKNN